MSVDLKRNQIQVVMFHPGTTLKEIYINLIFSKLCHTSDSGVSFQNRLGENTNGRQQSATNR